jgi:uncharacterized protein YegL
LVIQPLEPGDPRQLGEYQMRGRLGHGRMGQTFHGVSPGGHEAAVKLIWPELAAAPGFRARFAGEVARARGLRGEYLVPVVDADADARRPWVATAFLHDPSLSELAASVARMGHYTPMPPELTWDLAIGVAWGLREIHDAGLFHGNLTSSNVLLSAGPVRSPGRRWLGAWITDFGFSRDLAAAAGPAEDISGFGLVLVSLFTMRPVGSRDQPDTSGLPPDIRLLADRCLDPDPGRRPTAAELADELAGWQLPALHFAQERLMVISELAADDLDAGLFEELSAQAAAPDAGSPPAARPDAAPWELNWLEPAQPDVRHYAQSWSSGAAPSYFSNGPRVPLGERTGSLPHDGLFIRRNNAFGTKSTLGITDLIEQGVLIDQGRIRFDDFVGSRADAVPPPAAGEAVAVSHGLARTVPDCRASQHATHFLEIALRAADSPGAAVPAAPLPVNLVFAVDTSGSMSGEKLQVAKRSIRELYDQLRDSDILGIVSFATDVRTVLRAVRKADLPPARLIAVIEGLAASGGTDLNMGVRYGIHEISRNARGRPDIVNCLYLFSDGDPTSGVTNWIQIRSNIAGELRGDLTLSCFGFGADARMRELEALAGLTGGHCTQVRRPEEVRLNLAADLARREHLAAINIQLKIEISAGAGIWHLYGHDLVTEPATRAALLRDADDARQRARRQPGVTSLPDLITQDKGIRIFAPDLAFGEAYWIVLELAVPDGTDPGELGTATVRYVDAMARQARQHQLGLGAPGQLPEPVVAAHAIGLWTSEVTFYALDDLHENERETAKERLSRHIRLLRRAGQLVPAPQFADDQAVLAKLISLADSLYQPRSWDDSSAGGAGLQFTTWAMGEFGRMRAGYARRYF